MQWVRLEKDGARVVAEQSFDCGACGSKFSPELTLIYGTMFPLDVPVHCPKCFKCVGTINTQALAGEVCPMCKRTTRPLWRRPLELAGVVLVAVLLFAAGWLLSASAPP